MITISKMHYLALGFTSVLLAGCANLSKPYDYSKPVISPQVKSQALAIEEKNEILYSIKNGILMLDDGQYSDALKSFQAGLRLNPENGHLHFLHGLTYHLQSLSGDSSKLEFAETGYTLALKFDPANYWASYFLGQLYFSQRRYRDAQNLFSHGLLYAPDNAQLLRALSVASYYTKNVGLGSWAASKAYQIAPDNPTTLRALLFNRAAMGDFESSHKMLSQYQQTVSATQPPMARLASVDILENRIEDWRTFYKEAKHYAQADGHPIFGTDAQAEGTLLKYGQGEEGASISNTSDTPSSTESTITQETGTKLPRMAAIDVVILRTEESRYQNRGVNLLAGLQTTLGGVLYSRSRISGFNAGGFGGGDVSANITQYFSPQFTLTSLKYNFNIFNDGVNKTEILARPSLLAVENQTSKFYSGAVLHVQLSSINADGSLEDIPVGLQLEVTPQFHDDETIEVVVHAKRDSIEAKFEEAGFSAFSQTSSTSIDATAVLKFDETLILSGLSENQNSNEKDGVPLLQNIPILQYLFSNENELQTKKSVIILLTPRRPQFVNGKAIDHDLVKSTQQERKNSIHTQALKKKYGFNVTNNTDAALAVMEGGELYREFRSGDLKLDDWYDGDTLAGALKRTLNFLYY